MEIDMTTNFTQVIEITNENDEKEYMVEKNNKWVKITQNEYEELLRGK